MVEKQKINAKSSIDNVRRKLLKIGFYSVPTIMLLGRVSQARVSGPVRPRRYRKKRRSDWFQWLLQLLS